MTWIDVVFILFVVTFIVLGARLGSLWTGACILGGFFGAALVDTYALPLAGLMGNFPAATLVAAVLLFAGGIGAILIPGAVLSQIGSIFILHLIDGAFGLITGFFSAIILVSLILIFAVPFFPRFESSPAFRKSALVRPLHRSLEEIFARTPFKALNVHSKIESEAIEKLSPIAKEAGEKIKKLTP